MKDIIICSNRLTAHVNALGAEIKGVEMDGLEYLWQGDSNSYPRTSPTLFPIIGRFLSDTYYVDDQPYHMALNGIAMDRNFTCVSVDENRAIFCLKADERTRQAYPFEFSLTVAYTVEENRLHVDYRVENLGDRPLPFGIGCHTAYKWPLLPDDCPEDYALTFEKEEKLESFNPFGWRQPFVEGRTRPLSHDLFANYTRSITDIRSEWVQFGSSRHNRRVKIWRRDFPFMAIWTQPDPHAALICLEPCTSIHAGDHGCTRLEDREGTIVLSPGQVWQKGFMVEFE